MTTDGGGGGQGNGSDNQNHANGGNDNGGNSGANGNNSGGYAQALNADNLGYVQKKGWKTDDINVVVNSYRELERHNSTRLQEFQAPANPSDYSFKLPDGIPQDGFYNKEFADTVKQWFHEAKVPASMAQAVHDKFVAHTFKTAQDAQTQSAKVLGEYVTKAHDDLVKAWGSPETPAFKRNVEMSRRAMTNLEPGLKDALKEVGVIVETTDKDGKVEEVVTNAAILKALAKAGSTLYSEDTLYGQRPQGENPFDPKIARTPGAMQRQGELIKTDPELAKTLIKAAGVEKDWAHWLNR